MPESEPGRVEQVVGLDGAAAVQRRERLRALQHRDVRAVTRHARGRDEPGDDPVEARCDGDVTDALARGADPLGESSLAVGPAGGVAGRVVGERLPPPDHFGPPPRVRERIDYDAQPDPVRELRAELTLVGVHGADEQEAGGMGHRDALPLDHVHAERRRVEEHVAKVVVEQVYLVDVEDSPVRLGEQAGLERHHALSERAGDVHGAGDPVLGRVERQVDDAHSAPMGAEPLAPRDPLAARVARVCRVARERTVGDDLDLRQELGEPADGGRLAGAARALDENAPTAGLTALTRSACARRSWSTRAVNG